MFKYILFTGDENIVHSLRTYFWNRIHSSSNLNIDYKCEFLALKLTKMPRHGVIVIEVSPVDSC